MAGVGDPRIVTSTVAFLIDGFGVKLLLGAGVGTALVEL